MLRPSAMLDSGTCLRSHTAASWWPWNWGWEWIGNAGHPINTHDRFNGRRAAKNDIKKVIIVQICTKYKYTYGAWYIRIISIYRKFIDAHISSCLICAPISMLTIWKFQKHHRILVVVLTRDEMIDLPLPSCGLLNGSRSFCCIFVAWHFYPRAQTSKSVIAGSLCTLQ